MIALSLLLASWSAAFEEPRLVAGTQAIGGAYQFTRSPMLVEAAEAIRGLGADAIKFSLIPQGKGASKPRSLVDAARAPAVRKVLGMPFAHVLMWAYPVSTERDRFLPGSLEDESREMYDLARHLLRTYAGTGKSFYLGNWEGDWHLTHTDPERVPTDGEVANMVAWAKARQAAIDAARRDEPRKGVRVFHYLEVNRVLDAMAGKRRLANLVLPNVPVDLVSYSCYDALEDRSGRTLARALDYLEARLPVKKGTTGKRVFVGEYGFPASRFSPAEQDARSRGVLRTAIAWGCPFALYWQLYDNEVEDGKPVGYWMIDDKGVKAPIHETHRRYFAWARGYRDAFRRREGRPPTGREFGKAAVAWLDRF